ncbi:MAG: DUF1064 domain-containing protein [Xanthomonadales bacterium]|nr:DUF1064 domain-containing protein [Xanthomonadales bacterium]
MARLRLTRRSKYGAIRVVLDGITFDSKREAFRYQQLKMRHLGGEIANLEVHPCYELRVNSQKIGKVTLDFRYIDLLKRGAQVVEDAKSPATHKARDWVLRKKLLKAIHGVEVQEV